MKKNSYVQICRVLLIISAVLLQISPAQMQQFQTVRITTAQRTAAVRSITVDSNHYLSVKELSGFLAVRYYENMILRKAEIRLSAAILKFTADNPYVVQTNPDTKRSHALQLPQPVILRDGHLFVAVQEIAHMIKTMHDSSFTAGSDSALIPMLPPSPPME